MTQFNDAELLVLMDEVNLVLNDDLFKCFEDKVKYVQEWSLSEVNK